jgi:hypothetical protein
MPASEDLSQGIYKRQLPEDTGKQESEDLV